MGPALWALKARPAWLNWGCSELTAETSSVTASLRKARGAAGGSGHGPEWAKSPCSMGEGEGHLWPQHFPENRHRAFSEMMHRIMYCCANQSFYVMKVSAI